ncbi:hypothetical protein CCP3SC5AM1_960006 [Gammaproteobacteria bacterium]
MAKNPALSKSCGDESPHVKFKCSVLNAGKPGTERNSWIFNIQGSVLALNSLLIEGTDRFQSINEQQSSKELSSAGDFIEHLGGVMT